ELAEALEGGGGRAAGRQDRRAFQGGSVRTVRVEVERLPHGRGLDLPAYATAGSAGVDLLAAVEADVALAPGARALIPTGLRIALPEGFEAQVRHRSGLAPKSGPTGPGIGRAGGFGAQGRPRTGLAVRSGRTVLDTRGTIAGDYRGEVGVILANLGEEPFTVARGMRIAQMVVAPVVRVEWRESGPLDETARSAGGFGSTGTEAVGVRSRQARRRTGGSMDLGGEQIERYSRHILLPEVGGTGQARLLEAKVLVVGAGGLGSPLLLYLAAAGVGTIGVIDDDAVDLSNLQRQIIHATDRIGVAKVESAARTATGLNPGVKIVPYQARLTAENALDLVADYDLVADGTDNFATRFLVGDACYLAKRPLVSGAIMRFDGQIATYKGFLGEGHPCHRCLFREPPPPGMIPSCSEAGVLGSLPGTVG